MVLEATDIHKSFGDLEVLKGVDISIQESEIVAVMGASGAGKTTLLEILGTLSRPTRGRMTINGKNPLALDGDSLSAFRAREIGFVFQSHHLLPEFTALENVMIPAMIDGKSKSQAKQKALELLTRVGLADRQSHKPSELSGGEQQRVAIARALVNSPAIILADEPTGNLDSETKSEIHKLIFSLRDTLGKTFIIVTHDSELSGLCDRTLVMKDGRFV